MMPTRPLILGMGDTALGLSLLLQSPTRTNGPAYKVIKTYAPLHVWGLVLFLVGILLLTVVLCHRSIPPQIVASSEQILGAAGAMWTVIWAVALVEAVLHGPLVSWTGPVLWFFMGTVPHLALARGQEG